ncbi:unnamed protein product, partial [Schistosoma curassoni]
HMERYVPPINPATYPVLTLLLLTIGAFFMAWFSVYELTANKFSRHPPSWAVEHCFFCCGSESTYEL